MSSTTPSLQNIDDYVQRVVAAAPPLTLEQQDRLVALLACGASYGTATESGRVTSVAADVTADRDGAW